MSLRKIGSSRFLFTWRTKLLVILAVFSVAPVLLVSYWAFARLDEYAERTAMQRMKGLAVAKGRATDQFMIDRVNQVKRIAHLVGPGLRQLRKIETATPPKKKPPPAELHDAEKIIPATKPKDMEAQTPATPMGATATSPGNDAGVGGAMNPSAKRLKDGARPRAMGPPRPKPSSVVKSAQLSRPRIRRRTVAKRLDAPKPPAKQREDALEALRKTLGLILWDQAEFEELLVIGLHGVVVASTFRDHEGKTAGKLDYFVSGRRSTYIQHVFMSPITKRLTMVVSTPIRDDRMTTVGVLAARLNLKSLFGTIGDQTGLGDSGETLVVKKIGSELVFMAPTRHDAKAALHRRLKLGSRRSRALEQAARGNGGSGKIMDYRGKRVIAAWQHVPSVDWGLLVKMDQDESLAELHRARRDALMIVLLVLALAVLSSVLVSAAFVRSLRELRNAAERISKGDLNVELSIRSRDEVGELANSFERMIAAIKFFREGDPAEEPDEEVDETSGEADSDANDKTTGS